METINEFVQLNKMQQQAVTAEKCNLLILAGAGSGKTRVLVQRVVWLITKQQASTHSILAVTFTNKAATEMKTRLNSMLQLSIKSIWVGTFHGLAYKMLRSHYEKCNLPKNFQIIDSGDQLKTIKRILKDLNINEDRFELKKVQAFINRKKDEAKRAFSLGKPAHIYEKIMIEIYQEYETRCQKNSIVDFAELLLRSYELLNNNPDIAAYYQARFNHVLVDEFQDTNAIQYLWLKILTKNAHSVTVVGDDDQSIYGWRGAKVENIHRFEEDFVDTKIIRLEQNYRSTNTILAAANALISNNNTRFGKNLWTDGEKGEPIVLYNAFTEEDEANFVVRNISKYISNGGSLDQVSILYRSNAQSRVLEEALMQAGIAYRIYGGLRFFERAEIKDALAYLRLIINNQDNASFERIINVPPRGIGARSLEKISEEADMHSLSLWQAANQLVDKEALPSRVRNSLLSFINLINSKFADISHCSISELVANVITDSGLLKFFKEQKGEKSQARVENLEELINATADFDFEADEGTENLTLAKLVEFLSYTSLDVGDMANSEDACVQMMTLHSAKGLEFPVVFICGVEEDLFPHRLCVEDLLLLEEERRLCYVGITRAKKQLYISCAKTRRLYGREQEKRPSRFIAEIPSELILDATRKMSVNRVSNIKNNINIKNKNKSKFISANDNREFPPGKKVRHAKFGVGVVTDYSGDGDRAKVNVDFDKLGSKWLVLAYAKLEKI